MSISKCSCSCSSSNTSTSSSSSTSSSCCHCHQSPAALLPQDHHHHHHHHVELDALSHRLDALLQLSPSNPPGAAPHHSHSHSHSHSQEQQQEDTKPADDGQLQLLRLRFSKLLLGEDMSGAGKGVSSALTISNAITNLYATVFGANCHQLRPLPLHKKLMWQREMDCLLSVCDYILDFFPSAQSLPDGTTFQVMATRPRPDLAINLPALEKLDAMLLDMLDDFEKTEFWYIDQKKLSEENEISPLALHHHNGGKWWLPVPTMPDSGLSEKEYKNLRQKRDCAYQIHKAALAINCAVLAEMEVPQSYTQALPKSGRACVGDSIYRYMSTLDRFSSEHLLNCLNISSEHEALTMANCVEAAMYVWRKKARSTKLKQSWSMVKELMDASDKNFVLATRAESLLFALRQQFPSLPQSRVDASKIQHNKDVGQAVLESYSRVLESLAHNIVSLIDDVLLTDTSVKKR